MNWPTLVNHHCRLSVGSGDADDEGRESFVPIVLKDGTVLFALRLFGVVQMVDGGAVARDVSRDREGVHNAHVHDVVGLATEFE